MEHDAIRILNQHRIMAISTVRPDGWPQTTIVGYVNRGFDLIFMIFRSSQKYANIRKDPRISIAVASEPNDMSDLQAVYAGAKAEEITDQAERAEAWKRLMERHSNLAGFKMPGASEAVFMRARCKYVSLLDYTQGPGHNEQLVVGEGGEPVAAEQKKEEWGQEASAARPGEAP
jgi:nitroimidazol reductase NimA-like FMN-containing flavoprotein (pyridoxamine 5'-phosphate oxidase superfamily)